MSVLIVGGAGYIGSQTAKRIARAGLPEAKAAELRAVSTVHYGTR